jgi:hypothetical protein
MNRFELFNAMVNRKHIIITDSARHEVHGGYITAIQLEDGSGMCFNVTIGENGQSHTIFVRSIG